ncbi:hypothetical protein EON66_05465, partial [archaeon]
MLYVALRDAASDGAPVPTLSILFSLTLRHSVCTALQSVARRVGVTAQFEAARCWHRTGSAWLQEGELKVAQAAFSAACTIVAAVGGAHEISCNLLGTEAVTQLASYFECLLGKATCTWQLVVANSSSTAGGIRAPWLRAIEARSNDAEAGWQAVSAASNVLLSHGASTLTSAVAGGGVAPLCVLAPTRARAAPSEQPLVPVLAAAVHGPGLQLPVTAASRLVQCCLGAISAHLDAQEWADGHAWIETALTVCRAHAHQLAGVSARRDVSNSDSGSAPVGVACEDGSHGFASTEGPSTTPR